MVSVDLSAQVKIGCVVTKGTKLCLESVGLSVLKDRVGSWAQYSCKLCMICYFSAVSQRI